jgi:hypothetical protein
MILDSIRRCCRAAPAEAGTYECIVVRARGWYRPKPAASVQVYARAHVARIVVGAGFSSNQGSVVGSAFRPDYRASSTNFLVDRRPDEEDSGATVLLRN